MRSLSIDLQRAMFASVTVLSIIFSGCGEDGKKDKDGKGKSYSFSAAATAIVKSSRLALTSSNSESKGDEESIKAGALTSTSGAAHLCATGQTITCVAPSALTGKHYGIGLLIQAGGRGMQSYLLSDSFSSITVTGPSYDFNAANPVTSTGALTCCGGEGDLAGENTYFSNVAYVFGYLDATIAVPFTDAQLNQVPQEVKGNHTVRFVLFENAVFWRKARRSDVPGRRRDVQVDGLGERRALDDAARGTDDDGRAVCQLRPAIPRAPG